MLDLAAIQARVDKATPGPWGTGPTTLAGDVWVYAFYGPVLEPLHWLRRFGEWVGLFRVREDGARLKWEPGESPDARKDRFWLQKQADATFIAHARSDVPALLAEVHRLRAALEKIRDEDCLFCGDAASDACYETARTALGGNGP